VRAIVSYQQPGHPLFLQSQGKGLRVLTEQNTLLQIGDSVDVIGFPAMGEAAPILEDAVFNRLGHEATPEPVPLNLDAPWEQYDGAVVSASATLLNRQVRPDGIRLLLQHAEVIFDATLPSTSAADRLESLPLNSELQVLSICLLRSGGLLAHSAVLSTIAAFAPRRHGVEVALVVDSAAYLMGSRDHGIDPADCAGLDRGTRPSSARADGNYPTEIADGAVLEERNRIARELHDTLEQELAGITMQLDLAVDCLQQVPRVAQQALETARNMSRHSMIEARRSVWDLRYQLLEDGHLVSALTQIVKPLAPHEHVDINVRIKGTPVRLPGPIEMNLLRIGQQAVANAVKHGSARQISIELSFTPTIVRLSVTDDGRGFAVDQASPTGHLACWICANALSRWAAD